MVSTSRRPTVFLLSQLSVVAVVAAWLLVMAITVQADTVNNENNNVTTNTNTVTTGSVNVTTGEISAKSESKSTTGDQTVKQNQKQTSDTAIKPAPTAHKAVVQAHQPRIAGVKSSVPYPVPVTAKTGAESFGLLSLVTGSLGLLSLKKIS